MPVLQFCDVEETVPPDRCEEIALQVASLVAVVMNALGLVFLVTSASRCYFGSCNVLLPDSFITDYLALIGIPCAVLVVITQCIKKRRAASRTGANGDNDNIGGVAEVLDDFLEACPDDGASVDSDGSGERPMVQPPRQPILSSSSISMTAGGVSAGGGAVTAAYVELARVDHRRRSERERGHVGMPGEAVRDIGRGKNA